MPLLLGVWPPHAGRTCRPPVPDQSARHDMSGGGSMQPHPDSENGLSSSISRR